MSLGEIRIIAPSTSWEAEDEDNYTKAAEHLRSIGYTAVFGEYVRDIDTFDTASPKKRASDLHSAYSDPQVKAVMALNGGWLLNSMLPHIDWDIIRDNPKPMIGYSDVTVLLNAIYAKTGVTTYLGPNFGTLKGEHDHYFTLNSLRRAIECEPSVELVASENWWFSKSDETFETKPYHTIQKGEGEGVLIGGNLGSFYLLQGTEYQPSLERPTILAIEDDDEAAPYSLKEVDRRLESILQLPHMRENLRGILIGRFEPTSNVPNEAITEMVVGKNLSEVPIVSGIDFGHTLPMATLAIGSVARISATVSQTKIVTNIP